MTDYLRLPNGRSVWLAGDGSIQVHDHRHLQLKKFWPLGGREIDRIMAFWREVRDQINVAVKEASE